MEKQQRVDAPGPKNGLKGEVGTLREFRHRYEKGIIRSTSEQGRYLYCVVQRHADNLTVPADVEQAEVLNLFGNEDRVLREDLLVSETLIPTDIDLSVIKYESEEWIGREVIVKTVKGRPQVVLLSRSYDTSRTVRSQDIRDARSYARSVQDRSDNPERTKAEGGYSGINEEPLMQTKAAARYLDALGYKEEQIESLVKENWEVHSDALGRIITYGAAATWGRKVPDETGYQMEEAVGSQITNNVARGSLQKKLCFKPSKVLTAR